jgi:hypothetical protein
VQLQGGERHAVPLEVDVVLGVEQHPLGVVVGPDLIDAVVGALVQVAMVAVHEDVAGHVAHRRQDGLLHGHRVGTMKSAAALGLLQDGESVAREGLVVVNGPPAVHPVAQPEQSAELVRFAGDDFFKFVLVPQPLESGMIELLEALEMLRGVEGWAGHLRLHDLRARIPDPQRTRLLRARCAGRLRPRGCALRTDA